MMVMGIEALYRRPNTSRPTPGHKIYPYLLRKLAVNRPNQVWAMDITYIPMVREFVYLVALLDWFSRKVLASRLSVTLETAPCPEALNEAIRRFGKPEIMNSDQGSVPGDGVGGRARSHWLSAARGRAGGHQQPQFHQPRPG